MTDLLSNSSQHAASKKIKKYFFAALLLLASKSVEARIYITIDSPSEKKFPIAVVELQPDSGGGSRKMSNTIPEILKKDLALTGLFEMVSEDQFPKDEAALSANPNTIKYPEWSLIGVQALIVGSYSGSKVTLHLLDPTLAKALVSKTYTTNEKDLPVVAHHFADQVVQELTGEPGVFSTRIAYTQVAKKGKDIGVMDMDGERAGTITKTKETNLSPAFSPDGSQIAFTGFNKGITEIYVVGSSGGSPKKVTSNGTINVSPAWSPSGALTMASALGGDTDIYQINMSGNVTKKLTSAYGIDVNPSWSPDGSAFVFASERAGKLHLFRADAGGGSVQRLTFVGSQNDNPTWSPKGDKIAFQSLDGGWDIFIMNADGSNIQRLTSGGGNESPTWAPNGRFIAFSSTRTGKAQIHIMREDGTNATAVGPAGSLQPSWGPLTK